MCVLRKIRRWCSLWHGNLHQRRLAVVLLLCYFWGERVGSSLVRTTNDDLERNQENTMTNRSILRWDMTTDVAYDQIDVKRVRTRDDLFCLITSASFVESGTDTYTRNLVTHYADNPVLGDWLLNTWEPEELQHGRALRRYVEHVWPDFDWALAYQDFFKEYGQLCTPESLEASPCLEMVARCVVETGTATYYQAMHDATDEPVLKDLASKIRTDEVQHYKHFYHHFQRYVLDEGRSRYQVMGALTRRLLELRNSDSEIALRQVYDHRYLGVPHAPSLDSLRRQITKLVGHHMPMGMSVKMLLKPLQLPPHVQRFVEPSMVGVAKGLLATGLLT